MDLNQKIRDIEQEDVKENEIFNHTVKLQKHALNLKNKITENTEKLALMNNCLNDLELEIFKSDYEVNVLEIHQKETDEHIKTKLTGIMTKEEELKQLKLKLKQDMKEATDNLNRLIQDAYLIDNSVNKQDIQNEKTLKNEMYRLEGELEALKIYENYQNMKLKEIEQITAVLNEIQIEEDTWKLQD